MAEKSLSFPNGFLWGAATSSYQIEGGIENDWSKWEKSASRIRDLKRRGLHPTDFQSGKAANSWEMMEEDIECLKKINATAYRFSIEWARVEPQEGKFDEAVLKKYTHFVKRLQEEGIEPFVTLWHWPVPLWLHKKGGWAKPMIVDYFKKYSERIVRTMPDVTFWITLNEPNIFVGDSFLTGKWPPQKKNLFAYYRVLCHMVCAHRKVYDMIKNINSQTQIGIASPNIYFEAAGGFINRLLKAGADWWWNHWFLDRIKDKQDFIGLNFYFHNLINYGFTKNKNERVSDFGWELYPKGMYYVLKDLEKRYHKPIYITENGLADEKDTQRAWYIMEILKNIHRALSEGIDVRGYMHWSLIDNFEWAEGFTKKFGLFEVDRKTFERRPRSSVKVFAEIAKHNAL